MTNRSDGSTASYYVLPDGATELQDLISHRDMNAQIGEIFRATYRYGMASHSDKLRDAKKIKFYAEAEIKRLEALSNCAPVVSAADSGGWIEWNGGECPIEDGILHSVKFVDGTTTSDNYASTWHWDNFGDVDGNIIA